MVLISVTYHCVGRYNADVMEQRPPAFDAQLVAELVIRIISTETAAAQQDSKGSSSTGTGTGSNTSTAPANPTASAAAEVKAPAGKPRDRLSKLRAGAAAAATGATTGSTRNDTTLQQSTTTTTPASVTGTGEAVLVFLSGIQAIQKVKSALGRPGVLARYNAKVGHHTSIYLTIVTNNLCCAVVLIKSLWLLCVHGAYFRCTSCMEASQLSSSDGCSGELSRGSGRSCWPPI